MVKKLGKGSTNASSTPQQHTKTHKNKIQEKCEVGHVKSLHCPSKNKTHEPRSMKPRSSNKWRACYKCREKGHFAHTYPSTIASSGSDRDRSDRCRPGQPPLKATRQRWPLIQEQGLESSNDKKLQGMVWPTRTKAAFSMHIVKRVTRAKVDKMVAFLNWTLSIMISTSLGMTRIGLVLWGRLVHLKLA
jgi:hypothetical protein